MPRLRPCALLARALAGCSAPDAGAPAGAGTQSQPAAAPASKPAEAPAAGANPGVVAQTAALPRLQARTVAGEDYAIADIGLRMLTPRELYTAQGFPTSYIIDRGADGRALTKTAQVRLCGNSVCPPIARALVAANFAEAASERKVA